MGYHLNIIWANSLRLNMLGGLWIENPAAPADGVPRARGLALLVILAVAGPKGASRERILGILWPDSDPERARHALSQTLYSLNRALGLEVIFSTPDLVLDSAQITTDLSEFRAAVLQKNWNAAATLFAGPFLDGFYLADAPDFERWAESERANLSVDGIRAIEACAKEHAASGQPDAAADCWRRLTRLDPLNSRIAAAYMAALAALDDRTGALAHGKAFVELLRTELDTGPDQSMQQALARLRGTSTAVADAEPMSVAVTPTVAAPATSLVTPPAPPPHDTLPVLPRESSRAPTSRRRSILIVAGVVGTVIAVALGWRALTGRTARVPAVIAVGRIRDLVTPDSVRAGGVLSEMLSTSLGRLNGLQVIANSRIIELTPRDADTLSGARTDAGRRAGATEVIEGELIPLPNNQLRLEIRRVDLSRGLVRGGYRITGTDRLALFDSVTVLIAADMGVPAPTGSLAEVSTRSPIAYRLYEDGLRAFYQYDAFAANRLFRAAVRDDSTFAMATYYAWRSSVAIAGPGQDSLATRALSLASRASERDGLLIRTHIGFTRSDIHAIPAADSLVARYGNDPDALIRAAEVTADLSRATGLLNRAVTLDSAAGVLPLAVCRLCEALRLLADRYTWADSSEAVERAIRRWSTLRPGDYAPWWVLADHLSSLGRRADAKAARSHAEALGAMPGDPVETNLLWNLRADDVDAAWTECRGRLANSGANEFETFRWWCSITLRMQGRYREALALIHTKTAPGSAVVRPAAAPMDRLQLAILDAETGRPLVAADEFTAIAAAYADSAHWPAGVRVRNISWYLTLAATEAVEGGDTLRARRLVDTIEAIGRESLFPRDPVLHHFVRGLLYARTGQHDAAVREFRAAMVSPSNGYTRINYEMGESLLALGRPAEAIPVLRSPLHGGLDGAGLYLTRTEIHEMLARAFDAAGQRDSAAAHYAIVERAWRTADAALKPRYEAARQWLAHAGRATR